MDISTTIANIKLESCILNASGCWCTTEDELNKLLESRTGAIVSKSSTVETRQGNPEPRLYINDPYGSINSMGVPNKGFKFYTDYGNNIDVNNKKPFIQSILPFSHDDLKQIITYINDNSKNHKLIELNLSCPNLINKSIVAYDYKTFEEYLEILDNLKSDKLIFGIKLPPYYHEHEFETVSNLILKFPVIKFVTCINSVVNGLLIDVENEETAIHPKNGLGGIGGIYCKPTALANVYQFSKRIGHTVDIIGCGGVNTAMDIFEHILAGACAVQVGTLLMKKGPGVFHGLNKQLQNIMQIKEYTNITEFKGKLRNKKTSEKTVEQTA